MQTDLLDKMLAAQEQGDDELANTLLREFLKNCDVLDLPPELQKAYYIAQYGDEPEDPVLTERILLQVKTVMAQAPAKEPTIADAIRYALENPNKSRIGQLPEEVLDLVRNCGVRMDPNAIAAEPLSALLRRNGVLLQPSQADALSETLRLVYAKVASAARQQKRPSYKAARINYPISDD